MKKKIKRILPIILVVILFVGIEYLMIKTRKIADEKLYNNGWVAGFEEGVKSVQLSDLCFEPEKKGMGTDFQRGFGYDIVECKVNLHDWREDWEFEGDWDKCDENGENCQPFVQDGQYLEN